MERWLLRSLVALSLECDGCGPTCAGRAGHTFRALSPRHVPQMTLMSPTPAGGSPGRGLPRFWQRMRTVPLRDVHSTTRRILASPGPGRPARAGRPRAAAPRGELGVASRAKRRLRPAPRTSSDASSDRVRLAVPGRLGNRGRLGWRRLQRRRRTAGPSAVAGTTGLGQRAGRAAGPSSMVADELPRTGHAHRAFQQAIGCSDGQL